MRTFLASWCLLLLTSVLVRAAPVNIDAIDKKTFDNLVKYSKFAAAAYQLNSKCTKPMGLGLDGGKAKRYDEGSTQGYLVEDPKAKEYILVFEGTFSISDAITDAQFWKSKLNATGVKTTSGVEVHTGFQKAWNDVSPVVMADVAKYTKKNPTYSWTVVGHSLGGAMAEFASLVMRSTYPKMKLIQYSYGAPRAGNKDWAALVDKVVGVTNIYRGVHVKDLVPTVLGNWLKYAHPGTEYWQFKDPATPENIIKCNGGEDVKCSSQQTIGGLTLKFDHLDQFGVSFWPHPLLKADKKLCPVG
ncbi:hypothetical protein ONZ45_g12874 [Pleurotus djamor]|nr:hypothetical protein ONZ45_g12874 [Pleurotus djamor]